MTNFELLVKKLEDLSIPYELLDVSHAASLSIEDHVATLGIKYNEGMSTLIFKSSKSEVFYAVFRRDDRNINSQELKKAIGEKVNFCNDADLAKLHLEPRLASPLILKELNPDIKILVDKAILEMDKVVCGTTSPKHALKISKDDLLAYIGAYEVVDVTIPNLNRQNIN
jgi:hypothetical protein